MTSNPNSNAPPGKRAFDRRSAFDRHLAFERHRAFDHHRAASSLGCSSDDSHKMLFLEAIHQQRADIMQILPVEQILPFIDSADETGRTPLIHSVSLGDVNTCRILLQLGCDVNKTDKAAWTALHHAAEGGYEDIFMLLLDNNANPDCFTRKNYTPLHVAILYEHIGIISILQSVSKSINSKDSEERTPLNVAIENEMPWETIKILLDMGADPNIPNERGENPILCAVILGMPDIANQIIEHSKIPFISYNCMNLKGQTILHAAVENNTSLDIFKTHLGDFNLNIVNRKGKSPLFVAAELGYVNIAQELIIAGADINQTDPSGKTPLYVAAREGHEGIILALFAQGNPVSFNSHHFLPTALHVAVHRNHGKNLLFALLLSKDELEIPNTYGQTPLLLAMYRNNAHAVNVLVKNGANVDVADNDGDTPIEILRHSVNLKLLAAYLGKLDSYKAGDTDEVLKLAIERNMINKIIQSGINPNLNNPSPKPMVNAIKENKLEAAEALLKAECDPTYDPKDKDEIERALAENQSLRDFCFKYGLRMENREAEFLLARGAALNIKDYRGEIPLWKSVRKSNYQLSLKLLDAGDTASRYGKNFVKLLVTKGNVCALQEYRNRNIIPNLMARDVECIQFIKDKQSKKKMLEYFMNVFRDGDENGENVLFGALYNKKLDLMENILRLDSSLVNSVHKKTGESLLHVGFDTLEEREFLRLLFVVEKFGGDLDKVSYKMNETLLEKCIKNKRLVEAALLVSMKADCTQYAVSLASSMQQDELVQMMVDAGATPPPHWPKQVLSLLKLAIIACRKYIPQKGFRMAIKSLILGSFQVKGISEFKSIDIRCGKYAP